MKIIYETNFKELPVTCTKCRFSFVKRKEDATDGTEDKPIRICYFKGRETPMVYNKKKKKFIYERPKWCPLKIIENL